MQVNKQDKVIRGRPRGLLGMALATLGLLLGMAGGYGCTTQDFEYVGRSDDVYRITLENNGESEVSYQSKVWIYYVDRKDTVEVPNSSIEAGEEIIFHETEKGTFGLLVDIKLDPETIPVRISLIKGTGTGQNFQAEEVVNSYEGDNTLFIRHGEFIN